ncbi:MAG TPA: hypothetical protein HA252_06540 [Candidatus Diapherotrites archaeon]|uniref:Exosortase/archaeosortase family protein n=1 Tax=Candidatus Iainarchaeum sp. TaxID=3101447 RepID=A0A7J4JL56_9ARCH|nr:hypothetical protein [Candidatus Diapherotrites archaeon]HIH17035.1 hypothetical protein [Candidatus Diapherotrites archaeon]
MNKGFEWFLKRTLLALAVYSALSGFTYFLEGRLSHWFFNPAMNNFLFGSFLLFAFSLAAKKRLQTLPEFKENRKLLALFLVLTLAVLALRMGFEEGLPRKALSTLAGLLLVIGFQGKDLFVRLAREYTQYIVPSVLAFYIIDYVFDWNFLAAPVLALVVNALQWVGVEAFLDLGAKPPSLNVFNVRVTAVEETSGVDALILYSIAFLALWVWEGKEFRIRKLAKPFALGLLGALALVAVRLFALIALFGFLPLAWVNALALSPLNQALFLAYAGFYWKKAVKRGG